VKYKILGLCIFFVLITIFIIYSINKKNSIYDFLVYEIMDGNIESSFEKGIEDIINIYGEPIDIRIIPVSITYRSEKVKEMREYIYKDFIHSYYISQNGKEFYRGFSIEKKSERLKTINIGDSSDKLLSVFSDKSDFIDSDFTFRNNFTIRYYIWHPQSYDYYQIKFIIRNNKIENILGEYKNMQI
jgi:hypothetical protein